MKPIIKNREVYVIQEKIIILIPTLNEAENIEKLITDIFKYSQEADILIIDDSSQDGTIEIVSNLKSKFSNLNLIVRNKDHGYGRSCLEGFRYALDKKYNLIITMDADLSHPAEKIPDLVNTLVSCDMVIASRYVSEGKISGKWGIFRRFLSKFGNNFARFLLRLPAHDCTSGFRCYRVELLEKIRLDKIKTEGYALLIQILFMATKLGFKIKEIPFEYTDRRAGRSKLSRGVILETFFYVISSSLKRK
jgi:dolichol-phosphate mannosyltransferase